MSRVIELVKDVWTFGCKGDVLKLADEEIEKLDRIAQKVESTLYKDFVEPEKQEDKPIIEGEVVGDENQAEIDAKAQAEAAAQADAEKQAALQAETDKAAADEQAKASKKNS